MTKFEDAHVIVTGGSEGIGLAIAHAAAARGARVSLVARRPDVLEAAAANLGPSSAWVAADVADRDGVHEAIGHLTETHGPCDVLVANAGYSHPASFWDMPAGEFRREMEVNYLGAVHATEAVLAPMRARGSGHLCFVSSTAGLVGVYGFSAYSPTKFALRGLAESLRCELAPDGIAVSVLYPPDTDTPGFARENESKPPETTAISGTIDPVPASKVADAAIRGIERGRFTITVDPMTRALSLGAGLLMPLTTRMMDREVRRSRR